VLGNAVQMNLVRGTANLQRYFTTFGAGLVLPSCVQPTMLESCSNPQKMKEGVDSEMKQ